MSTIGDRVREERLRLGLSQQALARLAGISTSAVGNVEAGIRNQPRSLVSLARVLGVQPQWLETGHGVKEATHQLPAPTFGPGDLDLCLQGLGAALATAPADLREALAVNLAGWARDGGAEHWQSAVQGLLSTAAASRKRLRAAGQ